MPPCPYDGAHAMTLLEGNVRGARPSGYARIPPASLTSNFSWTLAGNVVYAACQWGMLTVLAKLGSPEMVGQFALAFAVTAPIMLLSNLKLRAVQATDIQEEYAFGSYLALRLVTVPIALIITFAIVVFRYDSVLGLVIMLVAIAKGVESVSDILFGLLQRQECMNRIALSQMAKGTLALGAFALVVSTTGILAAGVGAIIAAWLAILTLVDIPAAAAVLGTAPHTSPHDGRERLSMLRPNWSLSALGTLAVRTLPLGLTVMVGSLTTNVPQYFIEHFNGTYDLGLYAAMFYPITAGALVINALGQSATPRLARYHASGSIQQFKRLVAKLVGIGLLVGLGGLAIVIPFGTEVLTTLYGPEYAARQDAFKWLVLAAAVGFAYVFLGTAVTSMRRFRIQLPIHLGSLVILTIMCAVLVPDHGPKGAAWSLILSGLAEGIAYASLVWRRQESLATRLRKA